ncbi:MAG: vancomycin high temperature exclusion protein [Bacteroidota bacterium]
MKNKGVYKKWILRIFFGLISLNLIGLVSSYYWIEKSTSKRIFNNLYDVPVNNVGLVLGTSKNSSQGKKNLFFFYRIKAAAELYKAGRIKHILVSGDNRTAYYDEPTDMKLALIAQGIPENKITLDFAGLRTFDSVVRCHEIFGQNNFTIISQDFQNRRALFIADHISGTKAVAFNADNVSFTSKPKTFVREIGARFKCVLDLYLLKTKPRHLGKKEFINVN